MSKVLQFDEAKHAYTVEGRLIPSVTQILSEYMDFSKVNADVMARAQKFGTAVHTATELDDKGVLDENALSPDLLPYLKGWRQFRSITGFNPTNIETRLYSKIYGFEVVGTLDRVGELAGENVVLDIKTGVNLSPTTALQTAAYKKAFEEITGEKLTKRFACLLGPGRDNKGDFNLVEFTDKSDLSTFLSMLQVHNWRIKNGK